MGLTSLNVAELPKLAIEAVSFGFYFVITYSHYLIPTYARLLWNAPKLFYFSELYTQRTVCIVQTVDDFGMRQTSSLFIVVTMHVKEHKLYLSIFSASLVPNILAPSLPFFTLSDGSVVPVEPGVVNPAAELAPSGQVPYVVPASYSNQAPYSNHAPYTTQRPPASVPPPGPAEGTPVTASGQRPLTVPTVEPRPQRRPQDPTAAKRLHGVRQRAQVG